MFREEGFGLEKVQRGLFSMPITLTLLRSRGYWYGWGEG